MISLDTNVIVRYIVQDDKKQSAQANKLIDNLSRKSQGYITGIVLCELNWVLKSFYKFTKQDRISTIDRLISIPAFEIENMSCCLKALRAYEDGEADFSDYLIRELSYINGCDGVYTFDMKALKYKGFKRLK